MLFDLMIYNENRPEWSSLGRNVLAHNLILVTIQSITGDSAHIACFLDRGRYLDEKGT